MSAISRLQSLVKGEGGRLDWDGSEAIEDRLAGVLAHAARLGIPADDLVKRTREHIHSRLLMEPAASRVSSRQRTVGGESQLVSQMAALYPQPSPTKGLRLYNHILGKTP